MDPRLSPPGWPVAGGEMVIFEGHLEKISEILAKWERRYFVLSRTNLFDPSSIELAYYKDSEKKAKQKKTINLSMMTNVSPVQKAVGKEHVFALDCGKPVLLKASSSLLQNVWVAKLLECCSKDHLTYHVTVPAQPMSSYIEGLIKLAAPGQVTIVSPANGAQLVTIAFDKIRRFGCEVLVDYDIVWFETCGCQGAIEQFFWFCVPSGIEVAHIILGDIKKSVELTVRSFLIQEEGNREQSQTIYIARPHYGCSEYPTTMRQRILQSSLMSLATAPHCEAAMTRNKIERMRRSSGVLPMGEAPAPGDLKRMSTDSRKKSVQLTVADPRESRGSISPHASPSPSPTGRRTPLNQLHYPSHLSRSVGHGDFDSGINMEAADPSRHSAPCTYNVVEVPSGKMSLHAMGKMRSIDENRSRPTFEKQKKTAATSLKASGGGRRLSEFNTKQSTTSSQPRRLSDFKQQGRDSANGSVGDLVDSGRYDSLEKDHYNHLLPEEGETYNSKSLPGRSKRAVNNYDHLNESFSGMSLLQASKKQYVLS